MGDTNQDDNRGAPLSGPRWNPYYRALDLWSSIAAMPRVAYQWIINVEKNLIVGIATIALVFVGVIQIKALRTANEIQTAATRAWLAPYLVEVDPEDGEVSAGHALRIVLRYGNTGGGPALGMVAQEYAVEFPLLQVKSHSDDDLIPWPTVRRVCDITHAHASGPTVYPTGPGSDHTYSYYAAPRNLGNDKQIYLVSDAVAEQTSVVFVLGCLAYKTLGFESKSAYCFRLEGPTRSSPLWQFRPCQVGNLAFPKVD